MTLDSETAIDLPLESIDGDLLLVDGLSKIGPHSQEAYALRTFLDVRRNTAGKAIIILDPDGYRTHFSDSNAPFFLFCDFVFSLQFRKVPEGFRKPCRKLVFDLCFRRSSGSFRKLP